MPFVASQVLDSDQPDTTSRVEPASFHPTQPGSLFDAGYDNGIFLNAQRGPDSFELKANVRFQFRGAGFHPDRDSWTDNAGVVRPVEARQDFDIERARLVFSGHAFTPQRRYLMQFDGDSDSAYIVAMLDGWIAWSFNDTVQLQLGKRKVPAGRNWLLSAFETRLSDRPLASEFFRPSRTTGVWLQADPSSTEHYELMIGQGYHTEALTPSETGNNFAIAGSAWRDIVGEYGPARPGDFEFHNELAVRVGVSAVGSQEGTPGRASQETDFLRLTDGTRLTDPNALLPGATVEGFDVGLLAVDAAFKFRGWSANGEYFWRAIRDLKANIPVPDVGLQHGFYVEGGTFVLPQQFDVNSQYSFVTSEYGSSSSYAAGGSWSPRKAEYLKLTLDVSWINACPVNSTSANILAGDDGMLVRFQVQATF